MKEDPRNLVDELKGLPLEEIRRRLDLQRNPFATMILNIDYDLNIATIIRTHNAFCGQEVFYLGRRKFNRKGCVGTYLYENITHFSELEEAQEKIPLDYTWVGIDNRPNAVPLSDYKWPPRPLMVFGHENSGLDFLPELPNRCKDMIYIPQMGSVRSLNVGVAAGIAMYDYCLKGGYLK